jgi:hypothetical protein
MTYKTYYDICCLFSVFYVNSDGDQINLTAMFLWIVFF